MMKEQTRLRKCSKESNPDSIKIIQPGGEVRKCPFELVPRIDARWLKPRQFHD